MHYSDRRNPFLFCCCCRFVAQTSNNLYLTSMVCYYGKGNHSMSNLYFSRNHESCTIYHCNLPNIYIQYFHLVYFYLFCFVLKSLFTAHGRVLKKHYLLVCIDSMIKNYQLSTDMNSSFPSHCYEDGYFRKNVTTTTPILIHSINLTFT